MLMAYVLYIVNLMFALKGLWAQNQKKGLKGFQCSRINY